RPRKGARDAGWTAHKWCSDGAGPPPRRELVCGRTVVGTPARSARRRCPAWQALENGYRPAVPLRPVRNIMCLGKNFRAHAIEFATYSADAETVPKHPIVFTKAPEALCGAEDAIEVSRDLGSALDYEAELAVVIGRDGTRIDRGDALEHVAGYTVLNDVTARDVQ